MIDQGNVLVTDQALYQELKDKVIMLASMVQLLNHAVGILNDRVTASVRRLRVVEGHFTPVLWICANSHCGAPNETPLVLWPLTRTQALCRGCGNLQASSYMDQFAPKEEHEP